MHQDEDPADKKRQQARERKARWLGKQKQESLKRIREAKAASLRRHIQQLTRRAANAASRRRHIQQLTPDQAFQGFPKWSVLILQLPHCLKLCCFIMQFDTVIGYMRKKPQHGVKRVCKFLKWSVSF